MKKCLSATVVFFCFVSAAFARNDYDLTFRHKLPDTLVLGQEYEIIDTIYNDGPDAFPGGEYEFNYTMNDAKEKNSDATDKTNSFKIKIPYIPAGGVAVTRTKVKFQGTDYTKKDGSNIVIVFPTGDIKDRNPNNNRDITRLWAKEGDVNGVGIADITASQNFISMYPNPSQDVVTVNLKPASTTGTLLVCDPSGRAVQSIPVAAGQSQVSLRVSELPSGVYVLTMRSTHGTQTGRVLVAAH